jgi:exodeoxyribonuclease VII large subunit
MSPPEEQRFEFEIEVSVPAPTTPAPTKRARIAKPLKSARSVGTDDGRATVEPNGDRPDADEITESLKARIARLKQHASGAETITTPESSDDSQLASAAIDELEESESEPDSLSIAEFYARVKQALTGQFPEEFWVTGEIRSMRVSNGHRFIELADQGGEGRATQQLEVACWAMQWRSVEASLRAANVELEVGRVIRVLGKVTVWEAASRLRFNLTRIDVEALLGGIAAARQRLLNALDAEGILRQNGEQIVPPVPLRIGLVTSQGSEAQKDFVGRLERSGYAFEIELVHSLVQGAEAPNQITQALERLFLVQPDLIVIVRGGGSRNDLAAFDSEVVARAIAGAPIPVWVGIGHTGDHSVADVVANAAFITPTACGEAVVARVGLYWAGVLDRVARVSGTARVRLVGAHDGLTQLRSHLGRSVQGHLGRQESARVDRRARVASAANHLVRAQQADLERRKVFLRRAALGAGERFDVAIRQRTELLRAFDPERQLSRGWAIVRDVDHKVVRSVDDLRVGSKVVTRLHGGEFGATVEALHKKPIAAGEAVDEENTKDQEESS